MCGHSAGSPVAPRLLLAERSLAAPRSPRAVVLHHPGLQRCSSPPHLPLRTRRAGGCWRGGQSKAESPCREGGRAGAIAAGSRKLKTKKYNRFIRLNLERESLPLHSAEPGQGESHSPGAAPRLALAETRASDRPGAPFSLRWKPSPAHPSTAVLQTACQGARVGGGQQSRDGPAPATRLGRAGELSGERWAGGEKGQSSFPHPWGAALVASYAEQHRRMHSALPSQRASELLAGAQSSHQR